MIDPALLSRLTAEASSDGVAQLVVGAVVANSGNVLLLKRPADDFMGGIFELPSGKVEPGEDLAAALVREVFEETGLRAVAVGAYLGSFDYTSGSGRKSRQFNFVLVVDRCEPVVLQEHDEYRWVPVDEELPVTGAVRKVIETYQQGRAATTTADRSSAADLARSSVAARLATSVQAGEGMVHAEYYAFLLSDVGAFTSMPPADTNGLVVTTPGVAFIRTGIHTGNVWIRGEVHREAPALDLDPWDEVVEISLEATTEGSVIVSGLGSDGPETVPVLSPQGLGHYRIRVHARGRDTAVDMTTDEPVEHYLVQSWPAPPAAEMPYKHTDVYGAERRPRSR